MASVGFLFGAGVGKPQRETKAEDHMLVQQIRMLIRDFHNDLAEFLGRHVVGHAEETPREI